MPFCLPRRRPGIAARAISPALCRPHHTVLPLTVFGGTTEDVGRDAIPRITLRFLSPKEWMPHALSRLS
jgi:hypothetical protein